MWLLVWHRGPVPTYYGRNHTPVFTRAHAARFATVSAVAERVRTLAEVNARRGLRPEWAEVVNGPQLPAAQRAEGKPATY